MWPPGAVEFLRELHANNDRAWFKANRARYDELLVDPAQTLARHLTGFGDAHLFRPYADSRFNRSGPPIKENVAVALGPGDAGFYFELSLDGLLTAAGLNRPAKDQLERYRAAVDDGDAAEALERALAAAAAEGLELPEPELKRVPRGYPQDHPRGRRLRQKELTVYCRNPLGPWLHTDACDDRVRRQFDAGRPLVEWLLEQVGPTTIPPPHSLAKPSGRSSEPS